VGEYPTKQDQQEILIDLLPFGYWAEDFPFWWIGFMRFIFRLPRCSLPAFSHYFYLVDLIRLPEARRK